MENTSFSLKKRFFILALFVLFFVILFLLSLSGKNKKNTQTNLPPAPTAVPVEGLSNAKPGTLSPSHIERAPQATASDLGTITFDIKNANLPQSATVYTQTPTIIPSKTIARLQSALLPGGKERLINTPGGQVVFMSNDTKTLTLYIYSRSIVFTNSTQGTRDNLDLSQIKQAAGVFIRSLGLPGIPTVSGVKYFINKTGDLVETNDPSGADVFDLSFSENVGGITVFRQFGSDAGAHVWVSKKGDITKFTYAYPPVYEPKTTTSLPSLKTAEDSILQNKGVIVSLGNNYQQQNIEKIDSTSFTNVSVGYFSGGQDGYLYPIFVFEGTSVSGGVSYPIIVYLPID